MNYDENEIRKTFEVFNDGFTEVRLLKGKLTVSGYFSDAETLLKQLKRFANVDEINFYMTMNKIDDACYSRKGRDCFVEYPKETTADANITERQWMLIDMDCERAKGVSSSQEEFELSKKKATEVYKHLSLLGFKEPVIAISGNGYHLLYRISLENDEASANLIKDCLFALDEWFSDDKVKIDTTVFNAARITKLYGTMARKGQSTQDRPHRLSRITYIPKDGISVTDATMLVKLANTKTKQEEPVKSAYNPTAEKFDIDDFIRKHGIEITSDTRTQQGRRLILKQCPFNPDHNNRDAALFVKDSGGLGFKCFHASCSQNGWKEFRAYYEPTAKEKRYQPRINSVEKILEQPDLYADQPDFYTAKTIKPKDRSEIVTIKTGIKALDKRIAGLNKSEVSIVSGSNSSGKSSILSQVCLDTINQGYRVALFSGELEEHSVLNWIQLQAAGKLYTQSTSIEYYYYVPDQYKTMINDWLDGKLFVYNNWKGSEINKVIEKVGSVIKTEKVDLVILDNLMAMDLSEITGDKYEKQSKLIKALKFFAKQYDVHIVLVAHPRKSMGFLRKDDISGTADLTNFVDNVFIVHRVNNDFKRLSSATFGWGESNEIYGYDNIIEVCKNRDLGAMDYFVGMYYEPESKRFLNDRNECKHYLWEDNVSHNLPAQWTEEETRLPYDLD